MSKPEYTAGVFQVRDSYRLAKELAHADAAIRNKHFNEQQSNPEYWNEDKREQEADGVIPDPVTGKAYPILNIAIPEIFDPMGGIEIQQHEQKDAEQSGVQANADAAERNEIEKNGATIMDMVRAAPKVFSAMLKPADSPMALKRLEVCKGCEHWTGSKCRKCGCFTSLKVRLPNEACPIGKWAKEE